MRQIAIVVAALVASCSWLSAASVGEKGASVSDLTALHGKPDYAKAKLTLVEFWALW